MTLIQEAPARIGPAAAVPPRPATTSTGGAGMSVDWIRQWCATPSMVDRLMAINAIAQRRLNSQAAADVWLHLLGRTQGLATADETQALVRQFLQLAPEHPKAGALYDALMNSPSAGRPQPEIVFMITSCLRYLPRAEMVLRELLSRGASAVVVIGDPTLAVTTVDGLVVRLPVPDGYEALPQKVLEGLTHLRRLHGPQVCLVKLDDDLRFNHRFDPAALARAARERDYVGHPIGPLDCDRCWHLGKTLTPTPVYGRRSQAYFAKGAMYALGPRAIEHLVREWLHFPGEFAGYIYEDRATGAMLQRAGIVVAPAGLDEMGIDFEHEERYVAQP